MVEWNELEQADSLLKRGLELLALTTIPESHVFGLFTLARLRCAQGDAPGALEACRSAETRWPHSVSHLAARKARVWLALAEADPACASAVDAWAADHRLNPERAYQLDLEQITLARWLLLRPPLAAALGHPSRPDVIPFLSRQLDAAQRRQRMGWAPEILILQALAFSAQKRTSLALAALKDALSLAETEGYVRLFLEFGRHLAPLLRLAVERGASTGYAAQLLAILEAEAVSSHQHGKEVSLTDQLVDPLTARELDVLRLLAEGLSNRQIAQRLYLSPNTVRIHTSNIYSKLGVSSRTQAAARGRVLGFLD
jgi:LuxR family maltose regulon positive regulatory protein